MKCRICNSYMSEYIELKDIPIAISALYNQPNQSFKSSNVNLYSCGICGHHQIENLNLDNYYDDYLMQVSFSKKINQLQEKQINKILGYNINFENFIEIGCGDGHFLKKISKFFNYAVGYEPSKKFYELCKNANLNVVNDYFPSNAIKDCIFDTFVSRQVFEHIDNPRKILKDIFESMKIGGVGLIEVPNGRKVFDNGRYFEIISDHLNYFTETSLVKLVKDIGFEVICLEEDFDGDYLVVYVRKALNHKNNKFLECKERDISFIEKTKQYNKLSIWGAGAKAFNFINLISNEEKVFAYIDSDKYKIGKYLPKASKPIELPSEKLLYSDLIIIFAASYEDEIIQYLKHLGYKKSIMLISSNTIIEL